MARRGASLGLGLREAVGWPGSGEGGAHLGRALLAPFGGKQGRPLAYGDRRVGTKFRALISVRAPRLGEGFSSALSRGLWLPERSWSGGRVGSSQRRGAEGRECVEGRLGSGGGVARVNLSAAALLPSDQRAVDFARSR